MVNRARKFLIMLSAGDAFLVASTRRAIQKAAKVNSDLIGNNNNFQKIYEKIIQRELMKCLKKNIFRRKTEIY